MSVAAYSLNIDSRSIHKYLRREPVERLTLILKILICSACLLIIARIGYRTSAVFSKDLRSIEEIESDIERKLENLSNSSLKTEKKADYQAIHRELIFGSLSTRTRAAPVKASSAPLSEVALNLIGTFLTDGEIPYAIIEHKKNRSQDVFEVKDSIFGEATLLKILSDRVEIKKGEETGILKLDDVPDSTGGGESDDSAETISVDEGELDAALDNLPLLLTQARAVPYFKDGKSIGLRLFAIKRGSLYEKIGLKNGDILKSINGNSLADITQAVKLFEKLREQRNILLTLERSRKELQLRYRIQ